MPYEFVYKINNTDHVFRCDISTVRCQAMKLTGDRSRCSRVCAIGTPFCYSHLLSEKKLRIKNSTNPSAGKGLFAQNNRKTGDNTIVFKKGDTIIDYTGETIDLATLNRRYDLDEDHQFTAPYAYEIIRDTSFVDSACNRGVGSLVNHKGNSKANAQFVKSRNNNGIFTGVRLKAQKNIRNNTEIFASYGKSYRLRNTGTTHVTKTRRRR